MDRRSKMIDPRVNIISERLKKIKRILVVVSCKGGVGKSSFASILSLTLSNFGYKVGLLDLDFFGPSTHLILGIKRLRFKEERGVVPIVFKNIKFISLVLWAKEYAIPFRGKEASNAILELLSITRWGNLDFLIVDMPPGIGDITLDVLKLFKRGEFILVTTPSPLSLEVIKRFVKLLRKNGAKIIGVVENMRRRKFKLKREEIKKLKLKILASIGFENKFEEDLGNSKKLMETKFAEEVKKFIKEHLLK